MSEGRSVPEAVDDAIDLWGRTPAIYPFLLAAGALPWRFGIAVTMSRAFDVGADAVNFGPYWVGLCGNLAPGFVLYVLVQLLFARATLQTLETGSATFGPTFRETMAVFPAVLAPAAAVESLLFVSSIAVLPALFFWSVSTSLIAGQARARRASLVEPWRSLSRDGSLKAGIPLHGLLILAFSIVMLNLALLTRLLPTLTGLVPGFPVEALRAALSATPTRMFLGVWALAGAIIDPVRIGAATILSFHRTARQEGRDLRARLRELSVETGEALA